MDNYCENELKGEYVLSMVGFVNESCDFVMDGTIVVSTNEFQSMNVAPDEKNNGFWMDF
jgi:hypothetical protein